VAEAIFKSLNKNFYNLKNYKIKSAGIILDKERLYVADSVHRILGEKGIKIENEKPQKVDKRLIDWADKIVIVANDVDLNEFPKNKLEVWKVEDVHESDTEKIRMIISEIEKRVTEFIRNLNL